MEEVPSCALLGRQQDSLGLPDTCFNHSSLTAVGVDKATYRLILDLQYREITPNDYQVISELDNTVEKKALNKKKLVLFPTATVRIHPTGASATGDDSADGVDGGGGGGGGGGDAAPILLPGATPRTDSAESSNTVTVVDNAGVAHLLRMRECPVCTCEFEDGDIVRKLPCSHAFHQECIDTWFEQSTTCPNCVTEPETPASELPFDFASPCSRCEATALAAATCNDASSNSAGASAGSNDGLAATANLIQHHK